MSQRPPACRRHPPRSASRASFLLPGPNSFTQPHRLGWFSLPQHSDAVGSANFDFAPGPVDCRSERRLSPPLALQPTSRTRLLTEHPIRCCQPHHLSWFSLPQHKNRSKNVDFSFAPAAADLRRLSSAKDAASLDLRLRSTLLTATTHSAPSDGWNRLSEHAFPWHEHVFLTPTRIGASV